jgi:hypothetical protein
LRSIGDKAWRSRIKKKLKFSFSESRLNEYLNDLRELNKDFRTLAKQTSKLDRHKHVDSWPEVAAIYPSKKVEESRLVQRASAQLYDAMGRACQHHTEHHAHFQLLPQNVGSTDADSPIVHFNIAFTHGVNGTSSTLEPVVRTPSFTGASVVFIVQSPRHLGENANPQNSLVDSSGFFIC